MIAYASRTGTKRNIAALRGAGWRLMISARGVWRTEGFPYSIGNGESDAGDTKAKASGGSQTNTGRRTPNGPIDYDFTFTLRDYQARAVEALTNRVQGCAIVPCGGGKTVIGTAAIAETGQPAIVLVHTQDLADQWRETIRDALGIEAGVVADGRIEPDTITVATVQTLATLERPARADCGAGRNEPIGPLPTSRQSSRCLCWGINRVERRDDASMGEALQIIRGVVPRRKSEHNAEDLIMPISWRYLV